MPAVHAKIGFLLAVDVFSRKLFTVNIESKNSEHIRTAFEEIWRQAGYIPRKLETDQVRLALFSVKMSQYLFHIFYIYLN